VKLSFSKFLKWLSKPFPKKITFLGMAKYWALIFAVGIVLRITVLSIYPESGQLEEQFLADFCVPSTLIIVVLAPITENFVLMILPFLWKGRKGLAVGLALWTFFHYVDRDLPSFLQTLALAVFYYKAVSAKKYKESVVFHGVVNWIAALSCV
jgi:hypothetical protein